MNVKKNVKEATKGESLLDIAVGAVGGTVVYTLLPTVLKMSGPAALLTGALATWTLGAVLGQKGMQVAAGVLPAAHLMYVYGTNYVEKFLGRPVWQYTPGVSRPGGGMADVVDVGGEPVYVQQPYDLPAPSQGVNDYIYNTRQLNDYYPQSAAPPPATQMNIGHSRSSNVAL